MRMIEVIGIPRPYDALQMQPKPAIEEADLQPKPTIEEADLQPKPEKQPDSSDYSLNEVKRTITDINNISLTFNKEETFDYIGSESSLARLDIQQAISDMRKDKILEEYQYFVGGKPDLEYDGDIDGTVIIKK